MEIFSGHLGTIAVRFLNNGLCLYHNRLAGQFLEVTSGFQVADVEFEEFPTMFDMCAVPGSRSFLSKNP